MMRSKDWLAFILLGTIWGSSFLWIKIGVQDISPLLLVAFRLLFGLLGLALVALVTRPAWPKERRIWIALVILGFTNNAIPYLLISWGEQYIDSAVAAILNSTTPLFTMLIANFALHDDKLTLPRLAGLVGGFVGIFILVSRDLSGGSALSQQVASLVPQAAIQSNLYGVLGQAAVLAASILYAISLVFARRTTRGLSPVVQSLAPLLAADMAMWILVLNVENPISLPSFAITWVAIVWLGVLGTCVAFLLYYYLLHSVGPTRTALVTYVFPLVGVLLGVIFLDEVLDWRLAVGAALVVGSIMVVNRK